MGARACATVEKDICLVSVVLPGFLPAEILRKMEARCKPRLDLGHHCCQQPREAAWALPALQKAPGTRHPHTMFSDWEIVPWARCAETAPHPPKLVLFHPVPQVLVPWATVEASVCSRTIMAPSASSVCVCGPVGGSAHIPQRPLVAKALSAGPPQSSPADVIGDDDDDDDDPGETRTPLLRGTPGESCGGHLLRTLSGDLSKPTVPHCCAPHFWSSFLPALPRRTLATPNLQGGDGGGAAGRTEARPALFLLEPMPLGLGCIGFRCWASLARRCSGRSSADPWSVCPSTPTLQRPRHFLPF